MSYAERLQDIQDINHKHRLVTIWVRIPEGVSADDITEQLRTDGLMPDTIKTSDEPFVEYLWKLDLRPGASSDASWRVREIDRSVDRLLANKAAKEASTQQYIVHTEAQYHAADAGHWRIIVTADAPPGFSSHDIASRLHPRPDHVDIIDEGAYVRCTYLPPAGFSGTRGACEAAAQYKRARAKEINHVIGKLFQAATTTLIDTLIAADAKTVPDAPERATFYATALLAKVSVEMDFTTKQDALYRELRERLEAALRECFTGRAFKTHEAHATVLHRNAKGIADQTILSLRRGRPPTYKLK